MGVPVAAMPELYVPPLPDGVDALWAAFKSLSNARGQGSFGPAPLVFSEIESYARLHGIAFSGWEIETLQALDATWLAAARAAMKPGK
jgi:hypothetical protein